MGTACKNLLQNNMMTSLLLEETNLLPSFVTPEQEKLSSSQSWFARKKTEASNHKITPERQNNDKRHACEDEDSDLIYLPVDVDLSGLKDWKSPENPHNHHRVENMKKKGQLVTVNNTEIAVFRYGEDVLATQASCPHAGGPLHLGDIEVMPDKSLCVKCPWHKWSFCVANYKVTQDTRRRLFSEAGEVRGHGECVWPPGRGQEGVGVKVYPTKVDSRRKTIKIGFDSIDEKTLFNVNF